MSRSSGICRHWIPAARLPTPRKRDESGDAHFRWNGCAGWVWLAGPDSTAGRMLRRRRTRTSICATDSADRAGVSLLWLAAHHRRTGEAQLPGQSQARVPDHARGQSALPAAKEVCCGHHELQPHPPDISESGARHGADLNQPAWVADITYIRLELEFVYLAVILDVFSRRVIGWALDRTLEHRLTIAAIADGIRQSLTGAVSGASF